MPCIVAFLAPISILLSPIQSVAVAAPLALFQFGTQHLTGTQVVDPPLLIADVALAYGVYGADRAEDSTSTLPMLASSVAASVWLLSDASTALFSPLPIVLNQCYGTLLKRKLDAWKPFFVSACWVALTYHIPVLRAHDYVALNDLITPATLFLMIASTSQAADSLDIQEDVEDGLTTPAVAMGEDIARLYAVALAMSASLIGASASTMVGEFADVLLAASVMYVLDTRVALLATTATLVALVRHHDLEIVHALLKMSDGVHSMAIGLILTITDMRHPLPLPPSVLHHVQKAALEGMIQGDAMGSWLLRVYKDVISRHI